MVGYLRSVGSRARPSSGEESRRRGPPRRAARTETRLTRPPFGGKGRRRFPKPLLGFIGVALALLLTKGNLNVLTMIGIIMLLGLVTKNGILLVDVTNQQRGRGLTRRLAGFPSGAVAPR